MSISLHPSPSISVTSGEYVPYKARSVANFLISHAKLIPAQAERLTAMKLIKLVYLSHAYSLVVNERQLFSDNVRARKFGPVIPDVYDEVKKYGSDVVVDLIPDTFDFNSMDAFAKKAMIETSAAFEDWDGLQLSTFTHAKDSAWFKASRHFPYWGTVSDEDTKTWFSQFCSKAVQ